MFASKSNKFNNQKDYNQFKNSNSASTVESVNNNIELKSFLELYDQNISEYFDRLDSYDGFFSTQQLESVDFSKFEEHVFFDSAIEKTNYAFKKIFNDYPYDGNKNEVISFLNNLDGYTRYILQKKHFKNTGYIRFNGSHKLRVVDRNGWLLDDYKKQIKTGHLNLTNNFNFSFDFWLYPFSGINEQQVLLQKVDNNNNGYTVYLDVSGQETVNVIVKIKKDNITRECKIKNSNDFLRLNDWSHINISFESLLQDNLVSKCQFYVNGIPVLTNSSSDNIIKFDSSFNNIDFSIGLGTLDNVNKGFNGLLDELKIYSEEIRNRDTIVKEKNENVSAKSSLKLYLRFNEPSGNYTNNNIILDHSGNKLHAVSDSNDISSLRGLHNDIKIPLKYEILENNPVLFASHDDAIDIQNNIIEEAKRYDLNNPNSFWKLLPKNLFIEGSDFDNIDETYINEDKLQKTDNIFNIKSKANQKMINLFVIWARFFDQFKLYIDSITKVIDINYDTLNSNKRIDGMLLPVALKMSGFNFREILPYPIIEKLNNKNLTHEELISDISIRQIQNNLWQRFLINSKDVLMSKGTLSSISSVFNSFGLESSKFISIREFNGQNKFNIDNNFYSKKINLKEIDFSCGKELFESSNTNNRIHFYTPVYNDDDSSNKLTISDEWFVESFYNFNTKYKTVYSLNQSLLRLENEERTEGGIQYYNRPHINVVFERLSKENSTGTLKFYLYEGGSVKSTTIENVNLMSGELYHISLQRRIIKNVDTTLNYNEYSLLVANASNEFYTKEIKEAKIVTKTNIAAKNKTNNRFSIGFYNNYESANRVNSLSYETNFEGKISNFRIYNKSLLEQEKFLKSKTINTVSLDNGIESAILNIDLYEKLSDIAFNNNIYTIKSLIDKAHSQLNSYNKAYLYVGTNISNYDPFLTRKIESLTQNHEIDFPKSNNFVYINDFNSDNFKKQYQNHNITNTPRVSPDYLYSKDNRLSIDFSLVNFLNQDILKIVNINKKYTEKLSQISNLYDDDYKDLYFLRQKYFERLEKELTVPDIYQMYKYFDNILEELLFECIPSKMNYKGFNFVYESHSLERNKYKYANVNSLLPVISNDNLYSYHRDLSSVIKHRQTEVIDYSVVEKNKR